jgi:predicted transposase/invertase (TIGR01784 family)
MVHHVHDYGYKRLFSNVTIFRQLLESFIHEPWVKELDFSTAETVEHSFVSEAYQETESDLIYKLKRNEEDVYIYVLLEFQSTVQRFIGVRILNYITSLYLTMIQSGQVKEKLPPVFPILLYNGDSKWTAPETVAELVAHHELLGDFGIGFKYLKIIENEYTYAQLLQIQNIVSTLFLTENHYNLDQLGHELLEVFEKEDQTAVSLFLNWFKMLAVDGRIDSTNYRAFEKIYTHQMEVREMFTTAISEKDKRLIQEGEAKGKAEGLAEGLAEGELNALKKMAKQMKMDSLSDEVIAKYTGLSQAEIKKL